MKTMRAIPGTVTAFSILTSVAVVLGFVLIGGLWLLSTAFQHLLGQA